MAVRYTAEEIVTRLRKELDAGRPLFMPNTGMGLSAKMQESGGADLICISCTSWWRLQGQGSLAAFLPYSNCNELILEIARHVLPVIKETPVITLSGPHNPLLAHRQHLQQLWDMGISGVTHMPAALYGKAFVEQVENIGMGISCEVEFIRTAHQMNIFAFAFAADADQAVRFAEAGADVISSHIGSTTGGDVGAATRLTIADAAEISQTIFDAARSVREDVILFAHGGPMESPEDVKFVFDKTDAQGFIGGSAAERMPIERAILEATQAFKTIPCRNTGGRSHEP